MAWNRRNRRALTEKERPIVEVYLQDQKKIKKKTKDNILETPRKVKTWKEQASSFMEAVPPLLNELKGEFPNDPKLELALADARKGWALLVKAVKADDEDLAFSIALKLGKIFDFWTQKTKGGIFFTTKGNSPYLIRPCGFPVPWDKAARAYEEPGSWSRFAREMNELSLKR